VSGQGTIPRLVTRQRHRPGRSPRVTGCPGEDVAVVSQEKLHVCIVVPGELLADERRPAAAPCLVF